MTHYEVASATPGNRLGGNLGGPFPMAKHKSGSKGGETQWISFWTFRNSQYLITSFSLEIAAPAARVVAVMANRYR
jgi:hypothetical protein